MSRIVGGFLILLFGLPAITAAGQGQERPATPAEQFKALRKQYESASSPGRVLADEERMKFVGQVYRLRDRLAVKFVELAEKHPNDPIAVDALIQAISQVNGTPWPVELVGSDLESLRAFTLLERDHIQSDKLGPACERVSYGFRKEYEAFLRAVLAKNPHKEVRAQACLGLAHFLSNRSQRLVLIDEEPTLSREFVDLFGADYLAELRRQDRAKAGAEAETLFEQAARDYGDVKSPNGGTIGEKAEEELFGIRHLAVGKVAPDIEGEDQDGRRFKLSDYRGKVVLLDFWSEY